MPPHPFLRLADFPRSKKRDELVFCQIVFLFFVPEKSWYHEIEVRLHLGPRVSAGSFPTPRLNMGGVTYGLHLPSPSFPQRLNLSIRTRHARHRASLESTGPRSNRLPTDDGVHHREFIDTRESEKNRI